MTKNKIAMLQIESHHGTFQIYKLIAKYGCNKKVILHKIFFQLQAMALEKYTIIQINQKCYSRNRKKLKKRGEQKQILHTEALSH